MDENLCERQFITEHPSRDRQSLNCDRQVGALLLADTVNSAFNMAWIYNILVNQFGASHPNNTEFFVI